MATKTQEQHFEKRNWLLSDPDNVCVDKSDIVINKNFDEELEKAGLLN